MTTAAAAKPRRHAGVKRQPLYQERAQLDLDAKVPGRKHRGRTYRELLQTDEGRDYLAWMAEHFSEESVREFVRRILAGEDVVAERGRQLNPHWYEAGAMKAARNARFRLIPGTVRAQVIARARSDGQARIIERQPSRRNESGTGAPDRSAATTTIRCITDERSASGAARRSRSTRGGSMRTSGSPMADFRTPISFV